MALADERVLDRPAEFVVPQDVGIADLRDPATRQRLAHVARHLFLTSLQPNHCPDRGGFYLTMHYQSFFGDWESEQVAIGIVPEDKAEKYRNFSLEKCIRLRGYPDHVCSMQSRNPELNRWGGAIKVRGGFLGISVLPEAHDEVVGTIASLCVGLISFEEAEGIMDASEEAQRETGKKVDPVARSLVFGLLDTVYGS